MLPVPDAIGTAFSGSLNRVPRAQVLPAQVEFNMAVMMLRQSQIGSDSDIRRHGLRDSTRHLDQYVELFET